MTERYRKIGRSPLLDTTLAQARHLAERLSCPVLVGMRYGRPTFDEMLREARRLDLARIVVLPMAPLTVSSYLVALARAAASLADQEGGEAPEFLAVPEYGTHPKYVEAVVEAIRATAESILHHPDTAVILSAHSLPKVVVDREPAYPHRHEVSTRLIGERLGNSCRLAYQSQGTEGEWLGPSVAEALRQCVNEGVNRVVVVPAWFLSEHTETLYDLDQQARAEAKRLKLDFIRIPTLGTQPSLIRTLQALTESAYRWSE